MRRLVVSSKHLELFCKEQNWSLDQQEAEKRMKGVRGGRRGRGEGGRGGGIGSGVRGRG